MIKGLRGASIWSEDLGNLLPFYRDVLGLKVGHQTPGFVVLGEPGSPALALGTHSEVRGRNGDPARHMVALSTDDGRHPNLRRLLCDLIEEYGRHTGHADLIREAVDGRVGEDPPPGWSPTSLTLPR